MLLHNDVVRQSMENICDRLGQREPTSSANGSVHFVDCELSSPHRNLQRR